jgi:hypothetical protein
MKSKRRERFTIRLAIALSAVSLLAAVSVPLGAIGDQQELEESSGGGGRIRGNIA